MVDVYNAFSIRLIDHFNEGIDQLTGKYYSLDEFVNYKADMEYPLPMIYQSGFLTMVASNYLDVRRGHDCPGHKESLSFILFLTTLTG